MKISSNFQYYHNETYKNSFKGRTEYHLITDIHQNANRHCRFLNELMQTAKHKNNIILLDNGDIFKGIYPKTALLQTYAKAKRICPDLEIVYNVGNNDPGYRQLDRVYFKDYIKTLNKSGVKVISANIIDETTGKPPEGIKPYAIVNRDGDNILYVGFVVDKIRQSFAGMTSYDPIFALQRIAPKLKKTMKDNDCAGLVMLVHDEEATAFRLKDKAVELGLNPEFIIGGHVHHSYQNNKEHIYYPEPFGMSMTHFTLDINKKGHKLSNFRQIFPENCNLGPFEEEIKEVERLEGYDHPVAKSIIELNYKYEPQDSMILTELGTFYADAIKNITNSEIGLVPKSWLYDTLPKKQNGYITKMDILESFPQPFSSIVQIEVTPEELRLLYEREILSKSRIYESSNNVSLGINSDNIVKQIIINGEELFNEDGTPKEPNRKIKAAIDYFSILGIGYNEKQSQYTMYDAITKQLCAIEKTFSESQRYPVAKTFSAGKKLIRL